jgi:KDO2-lipid IV(A) lauroyltransferase
LPRSPRVDVLRAGTAVAGWLPGSVTHEVARGVGHLAARAPTLATRQRRALVARNLHRVYGPSLHGRRLEQLVDETFVSYSRYWTETLRLTSRTPAQVEMGVRSEGVDHLAAAIDAGHGAILALPHLGGWEWGGVFLINRGFKLSVVVETLAHADLFDWFVGLRQAIGMEVIPVGRSAGAASVRALNAGRVLCLLADRVVGATPGCDVEFFGEPTRLPAGPVTLAFRTGAPILPTAVFFRDGPDEHLASIGAPMPLERAGRFRDDVQTGTQAMAAALEALIRRAPTQWHLMQPNWPSDPGWA